MDLLQNGVDRTVIALWLGHESVETTQIYLHADMDLEMRRRVKARLTGGAGATVAEIRDLLGTTRKYAVPLCEYLDRIGVTRREGDLRFQGTQPAAGITLDSSRKP